MEQLPSNTPLKIYYAIDKLNETSGNNIKDRIDDPVSVFFYREIMSFDKEAWQDFKNPYGRPLSIFNTVFHKKDPLIFSALIQKGIELERLEPYCQWLAENFPNLPLGICEAIFHHQQQKPKGYTHIDTKEKVDIRINYFLMDLFNYLEKNPSSYSEELLNKFYDHFHEKLSINFLQTIVKKVTSTPNTVSQLVSKITEYGHDLNEYNAITLLLPSNLDSWKKQNTKFIIDEKYIDSIVALFELGFSPNIDYTFNGDNLFKALIKSENQVQIEKLLPYLTLPFVQGNIEEDKQIIDSLSEQPTYSFIRATYFKALFDHLIEEKVEPVNKTKLKI